MDPLAEAAAKRPEHLAVAGPDAAWTYAELARRADDLAARLAGHSIGRGAAVGVALPASALHVALLHAVGRAGAVLVPLDPRLPGPELAARCAHAGVRVVVADQPLPEVAAAGVPVRSVPQLLRTKPGRVPLFVRLPDEVQSLVFTSGTSGRARAAMVSWANLQASATASARNLGTLPDDRWLPLVPLHHIGGLAAVFRAAHDHATLQVLPRFDARAANEALDRDGVTLASVVPVMLRRLLDDRAGRPFPATLRGLLVGGDAAPPGLLADARALGAPVLPTYGMTEACSQVATASPADAALPDGSCGRPLPGVKVTVVDEAGRPLPPGEVGEVVVRGTIVARGYYDDPKATAAAFRPEGFHTGDLGRFDDAGHLFIVGRLDDRIVTGGAKVDPAQVEEALRSHPAVADAAVVGVPDATWGELVAAAVVLKEGAAWDEAALEAHARARLAKHQVPRRWVRVAELPRTPSGKLERAKVRAALGQG